MKARNIKKRTVRSLVATAAVVATLATSSVAFASVGSGGSGTGTGGSVGPSSDLLWLKDNADTPDNPPQGVGQASIDTAINEIQAGTGMTLTARSRQIIQTNCTNAINEAIARDPSAHSARVVAFGATVAGVNGHLSWWGDNSADFTARFDANWNAQISSLLNYTGNDQSTVLNEAHARINSISGPSNVCVALNSNEPRPANYDLSIATQQQNGFNISNGTQEVWDHITTSNNGSSINENLNVDVWLNWDGYVAGNAAKKSVKKSMTVTNNGQFDSPHFTPTDFGWANGWAAGRYWYDIDAPQQGKMAAAVNTNDREGSEQFSAEAPVPSKNLLR